MATGFNLWSASKCRATPQVALAAGGWLALVLEFVDERDALLGEVWVEVKVGPGQMKYYDDQARLQHPEPRLISLAPEQLEPEFSNVTWQLLYQCARRGSEEQGSWQQHPAWMDFCRFLEEQGVASDALGPLTDR